jgi:hypothetical protein
MTKDPMHPEGLTEQSVSNLLKPAASYRHPAVIKVAAPASYGGTLSSVMAAAAVKVDRRVAA